MRTGGTELDSVAVHIARQLLVQDVNPDKKSCMEEGDEEEDIDCVDDSDGIKPILSGSDSDFHHSIANRSNLNASS